MKKENKFINSVKRGFTLVELLVVVAILGILATGATMYITDHIENANKTAAQSSVKTFDEQIAIYKTKYKKLPESLRDLVEKKGDNNPLVKGGEGALYDPWENEYVYKKEGKNSYYVLSCGPDGQEGTDDDIRSDQIDKPEGK